MVKIQIFDKVFEVDDDVALTVIEILEHIEGKNG